MKKLKLIFCLIIFCEVILIWFDGIDRIVYTVLENYIKYKNNIVAIEFPQEYEVVIARYNEDVSWVYKEFKNKKVTIYNKGNDDINILSSDNITIIKLPNTGRESHTYLYHIVNNYDNLEDMVVFLQGNPFDHGSSAEELINGLHGKTLNKIIFSCSIIAVPNKLSYQSFVNKPHYEDSFYNISLKDLKTTKWRDVNPSKEYSNTEEFRQKCGINIPKSDQFFISYGANFAVLKKDIIAKPKKFYKKLLNIVAHSKSPIEGHYFERLWDLVFCNQ